MAQYSLQDAIQLVVQQSPWKHRYHVIKIKNDWELLMGKTVAKYTKDLFIDQHKLYIVTDHASLKNELSYNKSLLVAKINQYLGETIIHDIIVR